MNYQEVVAGHRAMLDRLIERAAVDRVRRLYDAAQAELERKLARAVGRGRGDSMSAHQHRVLLLQIHDAQAHLAGGMAGELHGAAMHARAESVRQLHADVARLDQHFGGAAAPLPTEQAGAFHDVVNRGRTSLLAANQASMARYGAHVVGRMEQALGLSLAVGETPNEAIGRVMEVGDLEWWRAERIVRTETSWAAAAAARDAIERDARDVPGLWMRWTEHASDAGVALDDRVGVDSLAMHGQVAQPGEQFTMPPAAPDGRRVSESLAGQRWAHPPNRPNDRAVLAPWRAAWGVPGWRWAGERVPVRELEEAPPPSAPKVGRVRRSRAAAPEVRAPAPPPPRTPADELREAVRGRTLSIQPVSKSGANVSQIVDFEGPGGPVRTIFKPARGEEVALRENIRAGTYLHREVACANLAPMFGVEVPPTALAKIEVPAEHAGTWGRGDSSFEAAAGEVLEGSAQRWMPGLKTVDQLGYDAIRDMDIDRAAVERLRVFDFVVGNTDRHFGNILFREERGLVGPKLYPVGIDHGLALPFKDGYVRDEIPHLLRDQREHVGPLLPGTRRQIADLDSAAVADQLARDRVDKKSILGALYRLQVLKDNEGAFLALSAAYPEAGPGPDGVRAYENKIRQYSRAQHLVRLEDQERLTKVADDAVAAAARAQAAEKRRAAAARRKAVPE